MDILLIQGLRVCSSCVTYNAIRASGPGGQNVNKVSSAIELTFNLECAQLPTAVEERLRKQHARRISKDGLLKIKAQRHRTQLQNRRDALERLTEALTDAAKEDAVRRPTKVPARSRKKRINEKLITSKNKILRRKPEVDS